MKQEGGRRKEKGGMRNEEGRRMKNEVKFLLLLTDDCYAEVRSRGEWPFAPTFDNF